MILIMALLKQRIAVHAACFKGLFVNGTWASTGCSIPEPEDAAGRCLAAKHLLFIGGSTTRNIFTTLCRHLNVEVLHRPCNLSMGWGCHDCHRGCRHPDFIALPNSGWQDAYATTPTGTQMTFSWKPEMLTIDDITFLKRYTGSDDNRIDAVIVHKSIHDIVNFVQHFQPINWTFHDFEVELSARAELLAESLKGQFPSSTLFWRDAFYNGKDAELEMIGSRLRPGLQAIFKAEGFHILPGHHVSKTANRYGYQDDGFHPHDAVYDVMISMIADVLCSPAS